jgi:hypothetical protein
MLVAVDKFTKWVEAVPITNQDSTAAINFIKSIVFSFRVPHNIITDNGTNFTSKEFKSYCESMGIKLKFASVAHPKTNGQVEKSQWLNMQRDKKEAVSTPRESQTRLGGRAALRALESQNYTQCGYSRNPPFFWSTAQKPCFQSKSPMKPQESRLTMRQLPQKHVRMISMHSTKQEM